MAYLTQVGDALSQLFGSVLGITQNANQSISGRCFYNNEVNWAWMAGYRVINAIFFWQENHCRTAYMNDLARAMETIAEGNESY